ncbi:MAG TPA: hypothetical protein VF192_07660 [Longimicrobiales bacterium]
MRRRTAAHLALALLAACTIEPHERDDGGAPPSSSPAAAAQPSETGDTAGAAAARPETRMDTLLLEGTAEPVELGLVRAPAGFPMPFSTYTTGDFVVEAAESEADGDPAARFVAAFGGVRNDDALLEVAAYPPGVTEAEAIARAERAVGAGADVVAPGETSLRWATREWRLSRRAPGGGWILGFAGLGRHGGRWFHVLARYPGEYADGFGPRAAMILDHWRWADGAPLDAPRAP